MASNSNSMQTGFRKTLPGSLISLQAQLDPVSNSVTQILLFWFCLPFALGFVLREARPVDDKYGHQIYRLDSASPADLAGKKHFFLQISSKGPGIKSIGLARGLSP